MSLSDRTLTTLTTLKSELGISGSSEDAKLERYIEIASAQITDALNRPQLQYEVDRVESVRGYGDRFLRLDLVAVSAIDSITYSTDGGTNSTTIDADSYMIEPENTGEIQMCGRVRRIGGVWDATGAVTRFGDYIPGYEVRNYTVTYTGGYITPKQVEDDGALTRTLPSSLEEACLILCARRYTNGVTAQAIKSERLMEGSVTYANTATTTTGGLPDDVAQMIAAYRRIAL